MCGMGRCGTLFASEAEGIAPDMVCIAKGLGAGIQPIGATLVSAKIYSAIEQGSGFFQHGHTYLGHAAACAAGVAVLQEMERNSLLANVNAMGAKLKSALEARFGQHPNVGDVRGRGLFLGVELVADKNTKAPFNPSLKLHADIKKRALASGLMVYPMGGTVDGLAGDHVLIAPPFIITEAHIEEIVEKLGIAVSGALKTAKAA